MNSAQIILTIILSVVGGLIVLYLAYLTFVYLAVTKKMYIRYDGHPLLRYFTHEAFPNLKAEPFSFKTKNNNKLRGFIYTNDQVTDFSKVIVFFHGIGNGHLAYTKEINRLLVDNRLPVIAYDYHGTGLSEGKNIIDLSWPLVDATYFFAFTKTDSRFANSAFYLVGHSWGGFVAGNITNLIKDERIKSVVVLNGLPSIVDVSARFTKGRFLSRPYYIVFDKIKMGRYANQSLYKTLKKTSTPTFIAHGEKDPIVPFKYTAPVYELAKHSDHITTLACPDHHHFVYLSLDAEIELMKMQRQLSKLKGTELTQYAKTIDYEQIGQQNDALFEAIKRFIARG